jgi:hypothetical protein
VTCSGGRPPPDVTRNGKGATRGCAISFNGQQETAVLGGWADRCRRRPPSFCEKGPPLRRLLGQLDPPGAPESHSLYWTALPVTEGDSQNQEFEGGVNPKKGTP